MSEPIKAGDMVMVVRWPHKHIQGRSGQTFPKVFTVERVTSLGCHCPTCREEFSPPEAWWDAAHAIPTAWLKRIPPLDELEDVKRDEEITA
jgi:hypothetical protein